MEGIQYACGSTVSPNTRVCVISVPYFYSIYWFFSHALLYTVEYFPSMNMDNCILSHLRQFHSTVWESTVFTYQWTVQHTLCATTAHHQLIPHPSCTSCWQVQIVTQTTSLCSAIRLQLDSTNLLLTYKNREWQDCIMNVKQTGYFLTLLGLEWPTNIPSKLKHCLLTTSKASTSRTTAKSTTTHTSEVATAQTTTSSRVARCGIQEQLDVTMLHVFLILNKWQISTSNSSFNWSYWQR